MTEPFFLRLVDESGATFFNLSDRGSTVLGCIYFIRMPERDESAREASRGHGAEITRIRYRNVVESCELQLSNTTDNMLLVADGLNALFHKSHERQRRGQGERVYLEHRPQGRGLTTDTVRSEVLSGSFQFENEALSPSMSGQALTLIVTWTRRYYWESLTLLEAGLANRSTSHILTTGGVTVVNHYDSDATDDNWVRAQPAFGPLPTPARFELTNEEASGDTSVVYIGRNQYSTPGSQGPIDGLDHILEGEDGISITGTPSGAASNGEYAALSWTGTSEEEVISWTLNTALLNKTNSNWFMPIIKWVVSPPANLQMKLRIAVATVGVYDTRWTNINGSVDLQELVDPVKLPGRRMEEPINDFELTLVAKSSDTGTHNLSLDFMQLTPLDSFRILKLVAGTLPQDHVIVDDGIDYDEPFIQTPAGNARFDMIGLGNRFMIETVNQVFYFLQRTQTGGADITRQMTVTLKYRARSLIPYIS
jgi:hypothetical protein